MQIPDTCSICNDTLAVKISPYPEYDIPFFIYCETCGYGSPQSKSLPKDYQVTQLIKKDTIRE